MSTPDRIPAIVAALAQELTTAAHAAGDARTLLAALAAADRHYGDARGLIYDAHDAALGLMPEPLTLAPRAGCPQVRVTAEGTRR